MSHKIGTMREFKTKNFKVVCDAIEDYDVDLSFDEDGSTLKALERGELICFTARVRVFYDGNEVGSDYLGGCIYTSLEEFMDHKECGAQNRKWEAEGNPGRCGSYFYQMITDAIKEARKTILAQQAVYIRKPRKAVQHCGHCEGNHYTVDCPVKFHAEVR